MKFITENPALIRLTNHQKSVVATIAQSEDGNAGNSVLSSDRNLAAATAQLIKLKMIVNVTRDDYKLTDLGKRYGLDAGILDKSFNITPEGTAMVLGNDDENEVVDNSISDNKLTNESFRSFKDYLKII